MALEDHQLARALGYVDEDGLKAVSHRFRDLSFKVLDGDTRLAPFVYHVYCHKRSERIMEWLVQNHLTGTKLWSWLDHHFGRSTLSPIREILKIIDGDATARPIIFGKDFISR